MGQKFLHQAQVEVDDQGRIKAPTLLADVTITKAAIDQSAAGYTTLGYDAAKPTYLLRLAGTVDAAGTVGVYYADDDAGTNEVAIIGDQCVGANGGPHEVREDNPALAPMAPAGKYLLLKTATSKFAGRKVVAN